MRGDRHRPRRRNAPAALFRGAGLPRWTRVLIVAAATGLVAFGGAPASKAQQNPGGEVPRAQPVDPGRPPRAEIVPRPEVVRPGEEADPAADQPRRPLASGAEGDLFTYANLLFSRDQFELAARQYRRYLESYPGGVHAEEAWYRLGESHLNLKDVTQAEDAYGNLLRRFQRGDFTAFAAYRLGTLAYTRKEYRTAGAYFQSALKSGALKDDVTRAAHYYLARSLQLDGRQSQSLPHYEKAAAVREKNPFWQRSMLALARIDAAAGRPDQALERYSELTEATESSHEVRAEALVQAGLIRSDRGETEAAEELFRRVFPLQGADDWKALARYGLIDGSYKAKQYEDVTRTYEATRSVILPDETRPRMLLMVGNSYRFLKRFVKAMDLYLIIEQYYGTRPEGREASYNKLICLYNLGDPNLPRFVDVFAENATGTGADPALVDQAQLLKAEYLFGKGDLARAAKAYEAADIERIPEGLRASALYHRGFAEADSGNAAASITTFDRFLEAYPDHELAAGALAKRALSYKELDDTLKALEDFDRIIEEFPDAEPVELAYQQAALLRGRRRDVEGMVRTFRAMLERFPESKGAAEATYWVGWGYYELEEYAEAIPYLERAVEMDPEEYGERGGMTLVLANFRLGDLEGLTDAVEAFRGRKEDTDRIPPSIFAWLGFKQFDAGDNLLAERYLMLASTPESPAETRPDVWAFLGKARLNTGNFESAVQAFDHCLAVVTAPADRARALRDKGLALLGLKRWDEAVAAAREGLELQKEGRVNAELWMLLGDIEAGRGNDREAIANWIVPSQTFHDPQITPDALEKSARALERLGEPARAAEIRRQREEQFPDFTPATADQETGDGAGAPPTPPSDEPEDGDQAAGGTEAAAAAPPTDS